MSAENIIINTIDMKKAKKREYMKEYEYATHAGQPTHNLGLNPKYINILEDKKLFLRNLVNDHWGWKNNV